jgi:hypothetical protein
MQAFKVSELLLSERYPQYTYRVASTGATLSLENSISFLCQFCQVGGEAWLRADPPSHPL